jgi:hypothetical protein
MWPMHRQCALRDASYRIRLTLGMHYLHFIARQTIDFIEV